MREAADNRLRLWALKHGPLPDLVSACTLLYLKEGKKEDTFFSHHTHTHTHTHTERERERENTFGRSCLGSPLHDMLQINSLRKYWFIKQESVYNFLLNSYIYLWLDYEQTVLDGTHTHMQR
jgi:hypothetical protein